MNEQVAAQRKLAGWDVVVNPSEETIRALRETKFSGFTFFEGGKQQLPWGVWSLGRLAYRKATEQEAEEAMIRIAGGRRS